MKNEISPVFSRGAIFCISLIILFAGFSVKAAGNDSPVRMELAADHLGISNLTWKGSWGDRNYVDKGKSLGELNIKYSGKIINTKNYVPELLIQSQEDIQLLFHLPENVILKEEFRIKDGAVYWSIELANSGDRNIIIQDLFFPIPFGAIDEKSGLPAQDNLSTHNSINGDASFCYWIPFSGEGDVLLMTMQDGTSFEYLTSKGSSQYFIHSSTTVDRITDTWRLPSTSAKLAPKGNRKYGLKFQLAANIDKVREAIYDEGGLDVRIIPGMTLPDNLDALCAIRCKGDIGKLIAEYPSETKVYSVGKKEKDYHLYNFSFKKTGENLITVNFGKGKVAYLDFFITEPLETLIKKRADFITNKQQIRDTAKWYDGLYSVWDMKNSQLLSPDNKGPFPDFVVGGSDDPSNGKPLYVSEKNVVYPDRKEIKALEYYEKKFVWGGLQRTNEEYPYPYGIYGSENWHENRSGKVAGYNSGGWGKERMWRTFDYTTHLALYYNLYKIARDYPRMVSYLNKQGYLERAYRTAMAFFEVPYNIKMGEKWNFHGWTDWAYKQGNFHERYIMPLIIDLVKEGETEKADILRREWEKKVKYFIYDDPWPFGSEMYVDRTAFESSYYVGEYAKENRMKPQEQLWYDKNKNKWYSHTVISDSATDNYLKKQLSSNLALRGIIEPGYSILGTAWASSYGLDYMSQMGGAAILDYAVNFSDEPSKYINLGYNSILSSWALMNTGRDGVGYWYPDQKNDGAVGWVFNNWQYGTTYFRNIPAKRGPWQYCGEIDHGLVGGLHALATYVVNDPLFGFVAYGGTLNLVVDLLKVIPKDGVRRQLFIVNGNKKLHIELAQDGFRRDAEIEISKDLNHIKFIIENRIDYPHITSVKIDKLTPGQYVFKVNNITTGRFVVDEIKRESNFQLLLKDESAEIEISKEQL
jgi:hypothetical protein